MIPCRTAFATGNQQRRNKRRVGAITILSEVSRHAAPRALTGIRQTLRLPGVRRIKCDGRKLLQTIHKDYLEKVGDLALVSLVDDAGSEERSNSAATLRSEPASRRTDSNCPF